MSITLRRIPALMALGLAGVLAGLLSVAAVSATAQQPVVPEGYGVPVAVLDPLPSGWYVAAAR